MKTKPFAQTLRDWRRKHKLTQAEAATSCKVPLRTWQNWESEANTPGTLARSAIETLMDVEIVGIMDDGTGRAVMQAKGGKSFITRRVIEVCYPPKALRGAGPNVKTLRKKRG